MAHPPLRSFVIDTTLVNEQAFGGLNEREFIAGMQATFLDNLRRIVIFPSASQRTL